MTTSLAVEAEFANAARRAIPHLIKTRARHYGRRPLSLETVYPGLSAASPDTLLAIGEHLVERETMSARRWFGFGGEVGLLNARAVLLLGRAQRRALSTAERQNAALA